MQCVWPSTKNYKAYENARKNTEETKQASEQVSDMKRMLELSDNEFKITTINVLRVLMKK